MKNQKDIAALKEQFLCECEVIEMRYEYGKEFTGREKYGIITELSEEDLRGKYAPLLSEYEPYILLSHTYGEVREDYRRNDKKFEMRSLRGHAFSIENDFDEHHPALAVPSVEEEMLKDEYPRLSKALESLSEIERDRITKKYFKGYSNREIAEEENVSAAAISISLKRAEEKIKVFIVKIS